MNDPLPPPRKQVGLPNSTEAYESPTLSKNTFSVSRIFMCRASGFSWTLIGLSRILEARFIFNCKSSKYSTHQH